MVYLETGNMSWNNIYGMGRYINELLRKNIYDCVICSESKVSEVPKLDEIMVIALDDIGYRRELLRFINENMTESDIIHFPANLVVVDVKNILSKVKIVLTIHDITPILFYKNKKKNGNYFSDGECVSTRKFEQNLKASLPRADCIIAVSQNTKKDVVNYFNINKDKVVVIYNGIDSKFVNYSVQIKKEKKLFYNPDNAKMIMAINGGKHKNISRVIIAFYLYHIKNRNANCKLFLIGNVNKKTKILSYWLIKKKKIVFTGKISDETLIDYYNITDGFIFASLYEGFGLPLLEALACGAGVICSDTSSLGELGEGYACLINPLKISEIVDSIEKIEPPSEEKIEQQRKYVNNFSWDKSCELHKKNIDKMKK